MRQTQREIASYKGDRVPRPTILCPEQSLTHRDGGWVGGEGRGSVIAEMRWTSKPLPIKFDENGYGLGGISLI